MKYKNIKKRSRFPKTRVNTYMDNLFLAVSDMYVDMVTQADISTSEAQRLVIRNVKVILTEIDQRI